jgi:hypothetical protein
VLRAGGRFEFERRGSCGARGEVMIFGVVCWKSGGAVRIDVHGAPRDAAGFHVVKREIAAGERGISGSCARIPFGDEASGEGDVDGDVGFARGIEIEDRSFHADGAAKTALELNLAKMFDEGGEFGGGGEREPVHGLAVGAGDGREGAPFVDDEVGSRRLG